MKKTKRTKTITIEIQTTATNVELQRWMRGVLSRELRFSFGGEHQVRQVSVMTDQAPRKG